MMEPEPIPLRTLIVLLSYELVISDPRYKGVRLMKSSLADPTMVPRMKANYPSSFKDVPKTVKTTKFNMFEAYTEPTTSDPPSPICLVHPAADRKVHALTFAQRELLYYETRSHDGCYKALGLYHFFFDLCPLGQKISVQLTSESPAIVDPQTRQILEFKIHGPKLNWLTTVAGKATFNNGQIDDEPHCVIAFPNPRDTEEPGQRFVVDMTRMQYGEAGRGLYSENYFLGTFSEFKESMKKICDETKDSGMIHPKFSNSGNDNELRLKACATKVWERWQNREIEGWCAFCGKPGSKFMRCGACKEKKVFYCCTEHQKSDWKLHKHTCQKNKN